MLVPFQSTRGADLGAVITPPPAAPVAAFSLVKNDLSVAFSDTSSAAEGIASWVWEFGDGGYSISQNPTHVYAGAGTYQATLTVTTSTGRVAKVTQEVTVPAVPVLSTAIAAQAGKTLVLPPGTYALDATVDPSTTRIVLQHGTVITVAASRTLASDLDFSQGGQLRPAGGVTLTLKGTLNIPLRHHAFDLSQGGAIAMTTATGYSPSICHFADYKSETNWRAALVAAHTCLQQIGAGGRLLFPARSGAYTCDFTGQSPISWTQNSIWWEGDGATASVLINSATDGTDLIRFAGSPQSVQRCGWRNMKIQSNAGAGHIWAFTENGISFSRWENLWVIQLNPSKSIMRGVFVDDPGIGGGGLFENQWVNGVYEQGSGSDENVVPSIVPAFDLEADLSLIVLNKWQDLRVNCHGLLAPFWDLHCTDDAPGNTKFIHQNEWRGINVELPRRGLIRLRGHASGLISDITYYDLGLNGCSVPAGVDGHLVQLVNGSGGRWCEETTLRKVSRNGAGELLGVAEAIKTVTSLSQAAGTATAVVTGHGYATGDLVSIDRAAPTADAMDAYNGLKSITVVDTNTITYPINSGTASPATGSPIVASRVGRTASITRSGSTATLTQTGHGRVAGERIWVSGAVQTEYNGRFTVLSTPTADTLTYAVTGTPATPATGTIVAGPGAVDFVLGPDNTGDVFESCVSVQPGDSIHELDANGSPALVTGHRTDRLLVVRESKAAGAIVELGGDSLLSAVRSSRLSADRFDAYGSSFIAWAPAGDIDGLGVQWVSASIVSIPVGRCRSDDDLDYVENTGNKQIDITLSGAGGLDTGSENSSTMYDAYLIWSSTGAAVMKGIAVVSGNAPVMPLNYDRKRYCGSFRNDASSNIVDFTMVGAGRHREVWYNATLTDLRALNGGAATTPTNQSLSTRIPVASRRPILLARFVGATAGNSMLVIPAHHTAADWGHLVCQVASQEVRQQMRMLTNTGRSVAYSVTSASDAAYLYVLGYEVPL